MIDCSLTRQSLSVCWCVQMHVPSSYLSVYICQFGDYVCLCSVSYGISFFLWSVCLAECIYLAELRDGSSVCHSPMKLAQAMKIGSNSELKKATLEDRDEERVETLERKRVEEQQREDHKEAEKRRREMEQLQLLTDARVKGLSEQEIEAWDEVLSAKDRRSSSDDDWETSLSVPRGSHEETTSRNLASRQSSQYRSKGSWSDFNAYEDDEPAGTTAKSVQDSQTSSRTTKVQFQSSGNKFVDFLDVEREERERLEALSQQENEFDLFADMQPAVARSMVASQKKERTDEMKRNTAVTTALNYNVMDNAEDGEWGDGDWGDELQ